MLDSKDFTFKEFTDPRMINRPGFTVGESGPLLLATNKTTGKQYVIKHTYKHNAANEYVVSWLAQKIGVCTPPAHLISHSPYFSCPYAVAITFIEGFRPLDKPNLSENMQKELMGQFALNILVDTSDILQLNATDEHIYSYDFSEAFYNSDDLLLNMIQRYEEIGIIQIRARLESFKTHLAYTDFDIPKLAKEFYLDPDKQKAEMISTAKRVLEISENDICEMSDELLNLYPLPYAVYYEECIHEIQNHMRKF